MFRKHPDFTKTSKVGCAEILPKTNTVYTVFGVSGFSTNIAFQETRKASKTVAFESLFQNLKITESSKGKNSYTLLFELMYIEKVVYMKSPHIQYF